MHCSFDLKLYPFDKHFCAIDVYAGNFFFVFNIVCVFDLSLEKKKFLLNYSSIRVIYISIYLHKCFVNNIL